MRRRAIYILLRFNQRKHTVVLSTLFIQSRVVKVAAAAAAVVVEPNGIANSHVEVVMRVNTLSSLAHQWSGSVFGQTRLKALSLSCE